MQDPKKAENKSMEATLQSAMTLASALAAAQAEFPPIPKTRTARVKTKLGGEFTYFYADLADIFRVILPILGRHGLAVTQPLVRDAQGKLRVLTRLMFQTESIESTGLAVPETLEPQETGILIGYWRRYDACLLLGVAPDEGHTSNSPSVKTGKETGKAPTPATVSKVTTETILAFIQDVQEDMGKKSKTPFLWITFRVSGIEVAEKVICEDTRLFETVKAAKGHDAQITLRHDTAMSYGRLTAITPPV